MKQSLDRQSEYFNLSRLPEVGNIVKTVGIAPVLLAAGTLMETIEQHPLGGVTVVTVYLAYLGHNIIVARSSRLHD